MQKVLFTLAGKGMPATEVNVAFPGTDDGNQGPPGSERQREQRGRKAAQRNTKSASRRRSCLHDFWICPEISYGLY